MEHAQSRKRVLEQVNKLFIQIENSSYQDKICFLKAKKAECIDDFDESVIEVLRLRILDDEIISNLYATSRGSQLIIQILISACVLLKFIA